MKFNWSIRILLHVMAFFLMCSNISGEMVDLYLRFNLTDNCTGQIRDGGITRIFINSTEDITENEGVEGRNGIQRISLNSTITDDSITVQFVWRNVIPANDTICYWKVDNLQILWRENSTTRRDHFNFCTVTNETYTINGTSGLACSGCNDDCSEQFVSDIVTFDRTTTRFMHHVMCSNLSFEAHDTKCDNKLPNEQISVVPLNNNSEMVSSTREIISSTNNIFPVSTRFYFSTTTFIAQPTPIISKECDENMGWSRTPAGQNATISGGCYDGTIDVTRYCNTDGIWSDSYCKVPDEFNEILQMSPFDGLIATRKEILDPSGNLSLNQVAILLNAILDTDFEDIGNTSLQKFTEEFLEVTSNLIMAGYEKIDANSDRELIRSLGSQLLLLLDTLALNFIDESEEAININEAFFVQVTEVNTSMDIIGIDVNQNIIQLPADVLKSNDSVPVRIASFLYQTISSLLTPSDSISTIVSPVISAITDCQSCPVMNLTNNVTIQLQLYQSSFVKSKLSCVFYQFDIQEGQLPTGDWSTSGCTLVDITEDIVTCSCNHLTHFAILLSPGIEEIDNIHYEVLNTIGLVLVPISLVCMILVVLTYSITKSLWNIRNYIHIMLCVSLFMAQFVFIIGVDKIKYEGPCSAIAVLLQYLFLVTFMWMLMEGVVLYVTLVRVFITNHKYYMISFTVASYAIPAVYMAAVIPIGYLVNVDNIQGHTHYLYQVNNTITACWLNYKTGFIWSFIIPVAIIILFNIGFFILTFVKLKRHAKEQAQHGRKVSVNWIMTAISFTLIMGITWIFGVLAFREELLTVAYVMTIFIAGQGIMLFIVLVPLSKQVRDAYKKLWMQKKSKSERLSKLNVTFPANNTHTIKSDTVEHNLSKGKKSCNRSIEAKQNILMKSLGQFNHGRRTSLPPIFDGYGRISNEADDVDLNGKIKFTNGGQDTRKN